MKYSIKCFEQGCIETRETDIPFSPNATFVCRFHTPQSSPRDASFQRHQFDPDLDDRIEKNDPTSIDVNWGMAGKSLDPAKKCDHGVYDPHGDGSNCSVCCPVLVEDTQISHTTESGSVKVAVLRNKDAVNDAVKILTKQINKQKKQPPWFKKVPFCDRLHPKERD